MVDGSTEERIVGIILAHSDSSSFRSNRSEVLHNVADTPLVVHAFRKAVSWGLGPLYILGNSKNADSISKLVGDDTQNPVTVLQCDQSLAPLDAVREALSLIEDVQASIAVIPANMPLLETSDTLVSMEAMLFDSTTNAQVPYVGLLNRSATKHPPVFLADLKWFRNLLLFLQLPRDEQDSKQQESWVVALRKAIGTHYCNHPEKILIRLCTIGYAVCAAREEDMTIISSRVDLAFAESIMQKRIIGRHQLAGVTIRDPAGTFLGLDVVIGADTELGVGVQIYGRTTIGSLCRIEGPTTITSSRLEDGVYIRSFTTLEGAYVNEGSGAGPYARLREGTELGPHSYLGNFVETKNARLGQNTLACHLTYLGDAEVGSRTNIGAGTITCNFNGIAKNKTVIGDEAFVGSNSTLVAPVSVRDNVIVAAGSVITENVPQGSVAFGRSRQVCKDGYSKTLKMKLAANQKLNP